MLFSVIVPIYNVENYLQQCVDSILSQTFIDFELILVDDGSPDRCPQMCDEMAEKDNRIVVIHKENGGLSDARNAGIRAAQGEYVICVDSDDFYATNNVFEKIAEEIKATGADSVQFHRKWFYENDNSCVEKKDNFSISCKDHSAEYIIQELVIRGLVYFSACHNALKLSFLKEHNLFFKVGIKSEDIEWGFRVFSAKPRISLLPDSFYVYRAKREGSISSSPGNYKRLLDYCEFLESSIDLIENGDKSIHDALMSYVMYHVLICSANSYQVQLNKGQRLELLSRLRLLCKGRMNRYTLDPRVKKASIIYKLAGYNIMARVMGYYLQHRKNSEHSFQTVKTEQSIS